MINPTPSQPAGLILISLTNLWERFGFYMTRSILVLYMAKVLLYTSQQSYGTFATFSALLYLTPQIGGFLADRFLGRRFSINLGGLLLSAGYLFSRIIRRALFLFRSFFNNYREWIFCS